MKKLLLFATLILLISSCKKEPEKEYNVTLIVTGQGNYHYQIGPKTGSGHTFTSQSITGIAHVGDYVELSAKHDSLNYGIDVQFISDPVVGIGNRHKSGAGEQQVQYQY